MGITIQQLSVFLENREGRLDEVLSVLAGNDVNIVALSLADTTEYGMLRMIVSDPNKGKAVLKENGITAMLTDVIALRVPHETGSLSRAMHQIVDGDVNIEYMYAFANGEDASAVLKCDDPARVVDILRALYDLDEGATLPAPGGPAWNQMSEAGVQAFTWYDGEFRDEDFGHLTCDMRIWCVHLHETEDPLNNLYLYLNADTGDLLGTRRVTD